MATTVAGPVRLPDGSQPAHGRVLFTPRAPIVGSPVVTTSPVAATITAGAISIDLQGAADGSRYAVAVEHWSAVEGRLLTTDLPDIVVTDSGSVTIADAVALDVPEGPQEHRIKRGDSLSLGCIYADALGRPKSLTGITVTSALRGPDGVTRALIVTVLDAAAGQFEITLAPAQTAALPLGAHAWDMKFAVGGRVYRTLTDTIHIDQEVTP
ncbi:hypothetical protein IQ03_04976 [Gemmobacter caeni]|uniref:Uncharacterized protein n=1 Tax=Gemmobacter caeni TaxID=589035 RepID=A0A2T6A6J4_9RHOB|nr:hypothetical protein [Gemmobacter caeni]PTX39405.1 hypothetical protein C8N34_1388 [Gemmobacter caeni]TWI90012.1 hypothetical protein IQ03_04976 [Gemmobacter caeni]